MSEALPNNTVGSIRIAFNIGWNQTRIEREVNSRTVVEGFATLGGAWTFMDGIFAGIFGSTLLLVLFGAPIP
jgi:hypothetical protein